MNDRRWTCAETGTHMQSYRDDRLDPTLAERLFDHVLGCDRCYREHWEPFQEETEFLTGLFLESLDADGRGDGGGTIDGFPALTLNDWTSTADLPLPSMIAHTSAQVDFEPEGTAPAVNGPHLRQIGNLLPRVPKRSLLAGYRLYLGDGPPCPEESSNTPACLVVAAEGDDDLVYLEAIRDDVVVDGAALTRFERRALGQCHLIELSGSVLFFQKTNESPRKRIGAGILRYRGRSWEMSSEKLIIGRGEGVDLPLPDRQVSTNLTFRPEALQALADPAERVREANLTLDAIGVSRRHAVLSRARDGSLELLTAGKHPVYVSRAGKWTSATEGQPPLHVGHGDEMLIGQMLLEYRDR